MSAVPSPTGAIGAPEARGLSPQLRRLRAAAAGPWILSSVLILLLTALMRSLFNTDGDVAWLLIAAGRMLDGAVPYRDIVEPNPPASILLYVPPVLVARLTGLRPGLVTDMMVTATLVGCLAGSLRILARAGLMARGSAPIFWCLALPILLLFPLASFSQRDHVVAGAILPILACLTLRYRGLVPGVAAILLAGIAAGVAVSIKPLFALALAGPMLAILSRQPWRAVLRVPEMWLAGALSGLYAVAVVVFVPDYAARILPLVVDIYLPAHNSLLVLIVLPTLWVWFAFAATFVLQDRRDDPFGLILVLSSVGFIACFFIQAKGFPYHGIPAIATSGLACASAAARFIAGGGAWRALALTRIPAVVASLAGLNEFAWQVNADQTAPGIRRAIAAISPAPRLLTIGNDSEIGPALASEIGATWVGSQPITWVTLYASMLAPDFDADPRFRGPVGEERDRYAADIARGRPDVLLVEGEAWDAWARHSPALAGALGRYARVGRFGQTILYRAQAAAAPAEPDRP